MPPIMGAGAFVMASYTQISYSHIVLMAFLPALLYFLSVAFFVRIEAKRLDFQVEASEDTPSLGQIMKEGAIVFILPITMLWPNAQLLHWAALVAFCAVFFGDRRRGRRLKEVTE